MLILLLPIFLLLAATYYEWKAKQHISEFDSQPVQTATTQSIDADNSEHFWLDHYLSRDKFILSLPDEPEVSHFDLVVSRKKITFDHYYSYDSVSDTSYRAMYSGIDDLLIEYNHIGDRCQGSNWLVEVCEQTNKSQRISH